MLLGNLSGVSRQNTLLRIYRRSLGNPKHEATTSYSKLVCFLLDPRPPNRIFLQHALWYKWLILICRQLKLMNLVCLISRLWWLDRDSVVATFPLYDTFIHNFGLENHVLSRNQGLTDFFLSNALRLFCIFAFAYFRIWLLWNHCSPLLSAFLGFLLLISK